MTVTFSYSHFIPFCTFDTSMHTRNIHKEGLYNLSKLQEVNKELTSFIFLNEYNKQTIDFSNPKAVIALNKALLMLHYNVLNWELPEGYLCPPIPSRVDYIHHIADLLSLNPKKTIKGIDIGTGANAIYAILGTQVYGWNMIGCDINKVSIKAAQKNIDFTPSLKERVQVIHQTDPANIFKGIINTNEFYDFTICNPPFHNSEKEALKGTNRKLKNLHQKEGTLNFGGQANELWCNGGESLFIKRMIKQSALFKEQVGYFTSLVSKKESLTKIEKQLSKLNASFKVVPMQHGNKQTRFIVWSFINQL